METFRSDVFAFANEVVERDAALDPIFATEAGVGGHDERLPDFSPDGVAESFEATNEAFARLDSLRASDDVDRVALAVLRERLGTRRSLFASHEWGRLCSVISSPLSNTRQAFELMGSSSDEEREVVATRLKAVRPAMAGWRRQLIELADTELLPSRRHIVGIADQAATYSEGSFRRYVEAVAPELGAEDRMVRAARDADAACGELSEWMRHDLAPRANEMDFCGEDRYLVWAKDYMGAALDLSELYDWGWEDLRRINERMWEIAKSLVPGAITLTEVVDFLDHDPARFIDGTDELLARLRSFTDAAVDRLDGVHFDIDPRVRFCDVRLAPEGGAAAPYYFPPSEDLSRPGTTWYPTLGATTFSWWESASTWYHEGVPGHHLQCGAAIVAADRQSRFQRLAGWTSGYGEGWALYAERLCEELGFFEDPGEELGYLAGQALRAARVVVDIGMHLQKRAPKDLGELGRLGDCSGRVWTPEMAVTLLVERALQSPAMAASEVERYLGIPAQAISYKVGERVWLRAREETRQRLGEDFSLKRFHSFALDLGPMGLDPLEAELRNWSGATN